MSQGHEESRASLAERLSNFLYAVRIPLIVALVVVTLGVIGYFVYVQARDRAQEQAAVLVEEADELFVEWLSVGEDDRGSLEEDLLQRVELLLERYPRQYAGQRALFIRAQVHLEKEDYAEALEDFSALGQFSEDSYLGVEGRINAAVLHEQLGNPGEALQAYRDFVAAHADSVHTPHALFAVGRLLEGEGEYEDAADAYRRLRSDHPESNWTDFAVNRIIHLESTGRVSTE